MDLAKNKEADLMKFQTRHFTRIYPSGARIDSSNYDPVAAFNIGSQIVALNFQTFDHSMQVNYGKFQQNGGVASGYVLKPAWMRNNTNLGSKFDSIKVRLDINIMSLYSSS